MKSILKYSASLLSACLLSSQISAMQPLESAGEPTHPWSISAAIGVEQYPYMDKEHGQTAMGRLAFGHRLTHLGRMDLGVEAGLQSGNTMRLAIPKQVVDRIGGVSVEGTVKPIFDGLLTLSLPLPTKTPIYFLSKAGGAYRNLQMDRESINDLSKLSPEVQLGLAFDIHEIMRFSFNYQHIFGGNPSFTADKLTETGHIAVIPNQDALFFGLTLLL